MRYSVLVSFFLLAQSWAFQFRSYHGSGLSSTDVQSSEVVGRTKDTLTSLLFSAGAPLIQLSRATSIGFFDQNALDSAHGLLYTQICSADSHFSNLYVGFENGNFVGFGINSSSSVYMTSRANQSCDGHPCRSVFDVDNRGQPTGQERFQLFDVTSRPWYTLAKASMAPVWSKPYRFALNNKLGLTLSTPVFSPLGVFLGVAGLDIELTALTTVLQESREVRLLGQTSQIEVGQEDSGYKSLKQFDSSGDPTIDSTGLLLSLVLYIVDSDTGNLLASTISQTAELIPAQESEVADSYDLVQEGIALLSNWQEARFLFEDHSLLTYNQSASNGINWLVVVVAQLHTQQHDHIAVGSVSYVALSFAAVLGLLFTAFVLFIVLRNRTRKIWVMAQVPWMCLILVGNAVCYACVLLTVGPNTSTSCVARFWSFQIGIVAIGLAFLAKLIRVMRIAKMANNLRLGKVSLASSSVYFVVPVIMLLVFLTLATIFDRPVPVTSFQTLDKESNVFVHLTLCSRNFVGASSLFAFSAWIFVLGTTLSFKLRNFSELMAESRALGLTVYHTGVVLLVAFGLTMSRLDPVTIAITRASLVLWLSSSVQFVLFVPKLWVQFIQGDLTQAQQREAVQRTGKDSAGASCAQPAIGLFPISYDGNSMKMSEGSFDLAGAKK